jgi:hypothetical protein
MSLGERANVMGPQTIFERYVVPPAMIAAADSVLTMLAAASAEELALMAAPSGVADLAAIVAAVLPGVYDRQEIIAQARINDHHYVKARLHGPLVEPFTLQFRLGQVDGKWRVWEAVNLTGRRGAWTR